MIINEIFYSIQGEGLLTGVPSVFIRLAGCPLRCTWCDTKYALDPGAGDDLSVTQIIGKVKQWDCKFVVLTGGEPMINPQLPELAVALKKLDKHITIETSGIKFIPDIACDLMSISPKTSNSGEPQKGSDPFFTVRQLINRYPYQLKFVADSLDDLTEIQETIKKLGDVDKSRVMLMPQAKTIKELIEKSPLVVDMCKHTGFTFCFRLQILLWDGLKGL